VTLSQNFLLQHTGWQISSDSCRHTAVEGLAFLSLLLPSSDIKQK